MYILIGSHKYELMKDVTESLAGRVNIIEMSPLSMSEIYGVEETPFSVDLEKINERISSYKIQPDVLYNRIIRGMYPNSTTILKKIRRSSTAIM